MLGTFSYKRLLTAADYNIIFRDFYINRLDLANDRLYVMVPQTGKEKAYRVSELMDVAYWVIERYLAGDITYSKSQPFSYIAYRNGLVKKDSAKNYKDYENLVSLNEPALINDTDEGVTLGDKLHDDNPLIEEIYANNDELIYNIRKLKDLNRKYVMTEHMVNLETVLKMSVIGLEPAQKKLQELLGLPDMKEIRELIGEILSFSGINLLEIL